MTIAVSVCFFSISVPITVQKTFSGPASTAPASPALRHHAVEAHDDFVLPTATDFASQMAFADWQAYCAAFAA